MSISHIWLMYLCYTISTKTYFTLTNEKIHSTVSNSFTNYSKKIKSKAFYFRNDFSSFKLQMSWRKNLILRIDLNFHLNQWFSSSVSALCGLCYTFSYTSNIQIESILQNIYYILVIEEVSKRQFVYICFDRINSFLKINKSY
jgi:hypothetical protein